MDEGNECKETYRSEESKGQTLFNRDSLDRLDKRRVSDLLCDGLIGRLKINNLMVSSSR